jgi:hypothetical protein
MVCALFLVDTSKELGLHETTPSVAPASSVTLVELSIGLPGFGVGISRLGRSNASTSFWEKGNIISSA